MHISRLTLTHFRGASSLPLDLHERLNVFVGANGAGKSTVLDAAAILLSWLANRIKSATASARPITESDIQNGKSLAGLELLLEFEDQKHQWKLAKIRKGRISKEERSDLHELNRLSKQFQERITATDEQVNLPLLVYYPVNRAVLDIPLRIRGKHRFDLLTAYDDSLTSGANFGTFFEWFREREDLENENRKYQDAILKPENFQFPDPHLTAVRQALEQFMPEFTGLTVRRNPLRMEVSKNGKPLTVNQLSDGEKCLMAMIGDLARRLAIANPVRENPLDGEGIVLMDEIDLHLHPKWQRRVVPKLTDVFPRCQFLVSTHSPHVMTHVQPENLFLLRQTDTNLAAERPSESYGKNVDRILEDLMGLETTRPDPVSEKLQHIYDLIDRENLDTAKAQIDELKNKIGEDPDLVKASVLIRRKELIGK
jgi:predicted ATP-binding protein involved in virulence